MLDVTSIYVPRVRLQGALQDQQVGLTRILSNDFPHTGSQSMWDSMHALWEWNFCLLQPSGSPMGKPFWPSKQFWGLVLSVHDLELGSPKWGSDSFFLGEGFCNVIVLILPSVGHLPRSVSLDYTQPVPTTLLVAMPSLYLANFFSASPRVDFIDRCFIKSCNFGDPHGKSSGSSYSTTLATKN